MCDAPVPREIDLALVGMQLVAHQRKKTRLAATV
jgi:hypothetical protein